MNKLVIREVAGTYGHKARLTFRGRTLEGFTASARLKKNTGTIDLTVALTEDDGDGAGYIEVTWQVGELTQGRHKLEYVLTTGSTREARPVDAAITVIVREGL